MKTLDAPLYNCIASYAKAKPIRFHMPCHKGRLGFLPVCEKIDITELGFNDNLHNPTGAIMSAQQKYAKLFGVKNAIFLTNGSSQGVCALVGCADKKILTQDSAHTSVTNGSKIFKKQLVFVPKLTVEAMSNAIKNDDQIDTVLVQSPDYFGFAADLKSLRQFTQKHNLKLFVDAAHGAHFGLSDRLPVCPALFCDAAVVSTHKTLGALTQTAVLLTDDNDLCAELKQKVNLISSTSPSYILLASIDYARAYAAQNAQKKLDELYDNVTNFCAKLNPKIEILKNDDFTKLVLNFKNLGISGKTVWEYLTAHNIYAELYDGWEILFYLSYFTTSADLKILKTVLDKMQKANLPTQKTAEESGPFTYSDT